MLNKEVEMWEKIKEIEKRDLISIKDFEDLKEKVGWAFSKRDDQLREMRESRDNWRKKYENFKKDN